jgi:hypothetical protein
MTGALIEIITSPDASVRNRPLEQYCDALSADQLRKACDELDRFRRESDNLYQRVRALFC